MNPERIPSFYNVNIDHPARDGKARDSFIPTEVRACAPDWKEIKKQTKKERCLPPAGSSRAL